MNRAAIRCSCGQRIGQKEVMHTGYYPQMFGPSLVCVRYRCARCKKLGQQYLKQKEWENGILKDATTETTTVEKERFEQLGPIEMKELVEFHHALDNMPGLGELKREFERGEAASRDSETSGGTGE